MSASEIAGRARPARALATPRRATPALVTGAALALAWWVASRAADALPGPGATLAALGRMASDGSLVSILWRTAAFMGGCFAVAVVLGVAGGLLMGMTGPLERGLSPYLAALQGMPTSLWIPVAAVLFGTDVWSLAAVVALGAVPAIALGTRTAVLGVPPLLVRAGRTLGESGPSLVSRVILPAALPGILGAAELGWSIAFRCLVAGEIFSGALTGTGIGDVIARSRATGDLTDMVATILVVLAFSLAVDRLGFAPAHARVRRSRGLEASLAAR